MFFYIEQIVYIYNVTIIQDQLSGCRAFTVKEQDGFIVVIAEHLSDERKYKTLWHELSHIILGHFDDRKEISLEQKEQEAENCLKHFLESTKHGKS